MKGFLGDLSKSTMVGAELPLPEDAAVVSA